MKKNGRTPKQDAAILMERVSNINKSLGTNYKLFNDGVYGWTMYQVEKDGGLSYKDLGFCGAKTTNEMYEYTDGIFAMLRYARDYWSVKV